jgi:uncharacterized protein YlxW (UPF0749 family)
MERSNPVDLEKEKNKLLKEVEELEREIEDIKKRIPPHSVKYDVIQLLEEKEEELKRKKWFSKHEMKRKSNDRGNI